MKHNAIKRNGGNVRELRAILLIPALRTACSGRGTAAAVTELQWNKQNIQNVNNVFHFFQQNVCDGFVKKKKQNVVLSFFTVVKMEKKLI